MKTLNFFIIVVVYLIISGRYNSAAWSKYVDEHNTNPNAKKPFLLPNPLNDAITI